ncbi:MAG: cysteine desulfurase [Treponema sp.]|nr:cysteine desulfurase [Treponema sp.]
MKDNSTENYFDWAATSPLDEDILDESLKIAKENWGNPSSAHEIGKKARTVFEEARTLSAKALNVKPDTVYFTSGGSESDQLVLLSVLEKPSKGTVLISSIEHPAIREQAEALKKCGWKVISLPCNKNGIVDVEIVKKHLTEDVALVCIMAVNNETGAIQPIYEIADLLINVYKGKRKPKLHVDCVQGAGKIPLNLSYQGIDSAALSSHKICGPRGIGILYLANPFESFLRGGGQEKNIRSGTENVLGAIAFSKCLEKFFLLNEKSKAYDDYLQHKSFSDEFVDKLIEIPECTIIPECRKDKENRNDFSPWIVQAAFKNIPGNVMMRALDAKGFSISTGSACSVKKQNRPILEAMRISKDLQESSVRFSFGPSTTKEAIMNLYSEIAEINKTFNKH